MADGSRNEPKRRGPASRPGASSRGRSRPSAGRKVLRRSPRESPDEGVAAPIRRAVAESIAQRSEQRLGFTARRAAILAAVVCVLTLTIAGPVRTYFALRTEMKQLAASEAALREQIADLESQKARLADPVYIAAQARERLGFVMPGDIPYQVQLPQSAVAQPAEQAREQAAPSGDPWYTALWHTIADTPHGPPEPPPGPADAPMPPPPGPPPPAPGG